MSLKATIQINPQNKKQYKRGPDGKFILDKNGKKQKIRTRSLAARKKKVAALVRHMESVVGKDGKFEWEGMTDRRGAFGYGGSAVDGLDPKLKPNGVWIANMINMYASKSARLYNGMHFVISGEDAETMAQLKRNGAEIEKAVPDLVKTLAPDCPFYYWRTHYDHKHAHTHVFLANNDGQGNPIQIDEDMTMFLQSLRWTTADLEMGSFVNAHWKQVKAMKEAGMLGEMAQFNVVVRKNKSYPKAQDIASDKLFQMVKGSPGYPNDFTKIMQTLEAQGVVTRTLNSAGNTAWAFEGETVSLAVLNFKMRQDQSFVVDKLGQAIELPTLPENTEIDRQNLIDAWLDKKTLGEYDKWADFPKFVLSDMDRSDISKGEVPVNPRFRRYLRTQAIRRAAFNAPIDDMDEFTKPLLKLLDGLLSGKVRQQNPALDFFIATFKFLQLMSGQMGSLLPIISPMKTELSDNIAI